MNTIKKISDKLLTLGKDGFFHILVGNVLVKMIAFFSSIVIVRLVSKQDYAFLGYADNLYQYINLLSGLGLSTAILKFCSPSIDKRINKYYYILALKVGIIFQLILSVALVVCVHSCDIPFPGAKGIVSTLVLFPTITQVVTTMQSLIRSQLNNKLYAKIGVVQTIALFITSVPLAIILGIYGVAISRYISMIVVIIISNYYIRSNFTCNVEVLKPEKKEKVLFWKISISMMLANLFSMIMPINELFLINSYIKDEVITANYKVAILIPSQIVFITSSVVVYLFPKIAQMSGKPKEAFNITVKTEMILLGLILFICAIGYVVSPILITVIYGDRYSDAIELSKLYWIVYGLNAGFRMLPMNVLPAIGSTAFNSAVSIISCAIHGVILNSFLSLYGIYGAPYALIIVYLSSGFVYWFYLYFKCRKPEMR